MYILPYIHFTITTEKTPEEARVLLESVTAPKRKWFGNSGVTAHAEDKDFIGKVGETDFEMVPRLRIGAQNNFQPVIEGQILTAGSSTVVDVQMRSQWGAYVGYILFFGAGVFLCLSAGAALIKGIPERMEILLFAFLWVLFNLLSRCFFFFPAEKARQKLEELFETVSVEV